LQLWIGPGHFVGWGILGLFLAYNFLDQQQAAHGYFAWSAKRWPFGRWTLAAGLLTAPLVMGGVAWLGLPGAALGALTAQLLTNFWVVPQRTLAMIGVPWRRYMAGVLAPLGLFTAAAWGAGQWGLAGSQAWAWPAGSLRGVAFQALGPAALAGVAAAAVAAAGGWGLLLSGPERGWLLERWRARRAKAAA
jgi:hypothetical protein